MVDRDPHLAPEGGEDVGVSSSTERGDVLVEVQCHRAHLRHDCAGITAADAEPHTGGCDQLRVERRQVGQQLPAAVGTRRVEQAGVEDEERNDDLVGGGG